MTTPYQTNIPAEQIEQEELDELVNRLAVAVGAKYEISQVFVISTEDAALSEIIDNVAYGIDQRKKPRAKPEDPVRKRRAKGEPKPTAGSKSYTDKDGKTYSKQALNKLLAAGELEDGFAVCSWRGERWVVLDGQMIKEPQA